jgi:hypothetical protein
VAVLPVVRALKRRRGGSTELLAFREGRQWVDVTPAHVNSYLKAATGGDSSAKDFRFSRSGRSRSSCARTRIRSPRIAGGGASSRL